MSPILDLQKRLREVGRIRLGETRRTDDGRPYPGKLEGFRFTSSLPHVLESVADAHGGDVRPWAGHDGEFELYTDATELEVRIVPGNEVTAWWEKWTGGGCERRCNGETMELPKRGAPCQCPADIAERLAAGRAKNPTGCLPRTRLSVVLPDVDVVGSWVLTSTGVNAATELVGIAEVVGELQAKGAIVPAVLRLDKRSDVKGGQTRKYVVPVLDLELTFNRLERVMLADAADFLELVEPAAAAALPAAHTPIAGGRGTREAAAALEQAQELAGARTGGKQAAPMGAVSGRDRSTFTPNDVEGSTEPDPPRTEPAAAAPAAGAEGNVESSDTTADEPRESPPPPAAPVPGAESEQPPQSDHGGPAAESAKPTPAADPSPPPAGALPDDQRINDAQRRKLFATARELGLTREDVAAVCERLYGNPTTKAIPRDGGLDLMLEELAALHARRAGITTGGTDDA